MAQRITKTTTNKIQILSGGNVCKSLQCNVSYRVLNQNELVLIDTAGQTASLFADQVNFTQQAPAAPIPQSFANAQQLAEFLDANFFAG
jgi:hypothetical protein